MKLKSIKNADGETAVVAFIPETEEEKLIMGSLRNAYYFGSSKMGTYPHYDGITSDDENYVTSMRFCIPKNTPGASNISGRWNNKEFREFNNIVLDEIHQTINEINKKD